MQRNLHMAATLEQEKIGGEMLDRARMDGLFVPSVADLDDRVLEGFKNEWPEDTGQTGNAGSGSSQGSEGGAQTYDAGGWSYPVLPSDKVQPGNYQEQIRNRAEVANEQFRDMLISTDGVVGRRALAYFLGLGLNDAMNDDEDNESITVLGLLCKNSNVSASSVRLALAFLDDLYLDAASKDSEHFTPLGLAIISAVRLQESDAKTQTFGDNAVEKVRVLLEHGASMCQIGDDGRDPVHMGAFLDMLEAGRARVEAVDLVALDQLRRIFSAHEAAKKAGVGSVTANPVLAAFNRSVVERNPAALLKMLEDNRSWDMFADDVDDEHHLPVLWVILKDLYEQAVKRKGAVMGQDTTARQAAAHFTTAYDLVLHWYLKHKSASQAFKLDSIACIFWFCVGAWRRLGAQHYDRWIEDAKRPFPLLEELLEIDFAADDPDVATAREPRSMGAFFAPETAPAQNPEDARWETVAARLLSIPGRFTPLFRKNLNTAGQYINNVEPGTFQAPTRVINLGNMSPPNGSATEHAASLLEHLVKELQFTRPAGMNPLLALSHISRIAMESYENMYKLTAAAAGWDRLNVEWTGNLPWLEYGRKDGYVIKSSNAKLGHYAASASLTFLQYPALNRIAKIGHAKVVELVNHLTRGAYASRVIMPNKRNAALKQMKDWALQLSSTLRLMRVVAGAMALSLGTTNNESRLVAGRAPKETGQQYALMNFALAKLVLGDIANATDTYGYADGTSEAQTATAAIVSNWGSLIAADFSHVVFSMPYSLRQAAPPVDVEHHAQLFAAIATFSETYKTHSDAIFADPSAYSKRIDTRGESDVWPRIPGALV